LNRLETCSPFIEIQINSEGEILSFNEYWQALFQKQKIIVKNIYDLIPPTEIASTALIIELAQKGKVHKFQTHLEINDNLRYLVSWRVSPHNSKLMLWGFETCVETIDKQSIDEVQLNINTLLNDNLYLWSYNTQTNHLQISDKACEVLGIKPCIKQLKEFILKSGVKISKEIILKIQQGLKQNRQYNFDAKLSNPNTTITDIHICVRSINRNDVPVIVYGYFQDITERKKAEEELRYRTLESEIKSIELHKTNQRLSEAFIRLEKVKNELEQREQNYRQIFNSTSDAIFVIHANTLLLLDVNQTMLEMYGYSDKEEVLGKPICNFLVDGVEQNSEIIVKDFREVIDKNIKKVCEWHARRKDGSSFWMEVSLQSVDINHNLTIIASARNISTSKEYKKALEYKTQLLQNILNIAARLSTFEINPIDTTVNKALEDLAKAMNIEKIVIFDYDFQNRWLDKNNEYPQSNTIPQQIFGEYLPTEIKSTLLGGRKTDYLTIYQTTDHPFYNFIVKHTGLKSILLIPLFYTSDNVGIIGFGSTNKERQWTEDEFSILKLFATILINLRIRHNYEENLKQSKDEAELRENKIRLLLQNSSLGILNVKPDGTILELNPAVLSILGSPSAEATKKINVLNAQPLVQTGFSADFKKCVEQRIAVKNEMPYTSVWGKMVNARYILSPVINRDILESVLVYIEDFTEMHQARENLIRLKRKAEESDRMKSVFLANMSHEIRTPMNGIIGFAELLNETNPDEETRREYTRIITSNAYHLLDLINDIIELSKIESGEITPNLSAVNINELILNVYNLLEPIARKSNLKLAFIADFPTETSTIITDSVKVRQVLINLINNAIKFTDKGSITFGYKRKGQEIEFFVSDTGKGIPPDQKENIFQRFVQLDNQPKVSRTGAGLGLSISKAIVESLGGKIYVESTQGIGSTFYFTIPFQFITAQNEFVLKKSSPLQDKKFQNRNILLVEDDPINQSLISKILEDCGAKIYCMNTAEDAIEFVRKESSIDLILMDIKLPKMDGLQATREIRKFNATIPIIAQTAFAFSEELNKTIAAGCNDFITKPAKKQILIEILSKYLY